METENEKSKESKVPKEEIIVSPSYFDKPKKRNFIIPLILILALVGALGYIAYDKWEEEDTKVKSEIFQNGTIYGYQGAQLDMFNFVSKCDKSLQINSIDPVTNQTTVRNIVALECYTDSAQQPLQ